MVHKLVPVLAVVAFLTPSTVLANDTMDALTGGNGLYIEYDSGESLTVYFDASGTFSTDDGRSGTWTIDGDELCQSVDDGSSGCTTLDSGMSVGQSWRMYDIFGTEVTASIV